MSGLTGDGIFLLQSAISAGVRVDVVNILAMDWSSASAPNGANGMGGYATLAATYVYAQLQQISLNTAVVGITAKYPVL